MYIYRPQTKFAKVMFLHVSVCPQGEYLARYPPGQVQLPGQVHPPWAGTPPGQVHPAPPGSPQEQRMLGDTGSKRAVRILLKCIFVSGTFTSMIALCNIKHKIEPVISYYESDLHL